MTYQQQTVDVTMHAAAAALAATAVYGSFFCCSSAAADADAMVPVCYPATAADAMTTTDAAASF